MPLVAIGRRGDCDDVLFRLDDGTGRVVVVHLTWRMSVEADPQLPWCLLFADMEDWARHWMIPDHEESRVAEE